MRKEKSWTRQQYDEAYRFYRIYGQIDNFISYGAISAEAERAADYSYQAYGYEMSGWMSDRRRKRFLEIKWRVLSRQEIPF